MAGRAGLVLKRASVRIVIVVAFGAPIRQSEARLAEPSGLPFEPSNGGVGDGGGGVTIPARQISVTPDKAESRIAVIE